MVTPSERIRSYDQYLKKYLPRSTEAERRAKLTDAQRAREDGEHIAQEALEKIRKILP